MPMRIFTCRCEYRYIVGKKNVYGPIFPNKSAGVARLMTRKEWKGQYADCAYPYMRAEKAGIA